MRDVGYGGMGKLSENRILEKMEFSTHKEIISSANRS